MKRKYLWTSGSAIIALMHAASAHAQTADAPADDAELVQSAIMVTAQKRENWA